MLFRLSTAAICPEAPPAPSLTRPPSMPGQIPPVRLLPLHPLPSSQAAKLSRPHDSFLPLSDYPVHSSSMLGHTFPSRLEHPQPCSPSSPAEKSKPPRRPLLSAVLSLFYLTYFLSMSGEAPHSPSLVILHCLLLYASTLPFLSPLLLYP